MVCSIELSVIIVNYNTSDLLVKCLHSVFLGTNQIMMEVIVVDNASSDSSKNKVRHIFPQVYLISNDENIGYAAAINIGLSIAKGKYLLVLNPDTELPPNALSELLDFMENNPKIGMISPKLIRSNGSLDQACNRRFPRRRDIIFHLFWLDRIFPKSKMFGYYTMAHVDESLPSEIDCIAGAFMLVSRKAVNEVGPMDERYFMYAEDVDWAFRFKQAGWMVFYYPQIEVLHHKRASTLQIAPLMLRQFYKSNYQYYEKYFKPVTPFYINWLIRFAFRIRMNISLMIWRISGKWI